MKPTDELSRKKTEFIDDQIFSLTLMATTQRSKIYASDSTESDRENFRTALKAELKSRASMYENKVTREQHHKNIVDLSDSLSAPHTAGLNEGRFRIGLAQKALNLYLKYLWCLGRLGNDNEPPDCPIDRIVLGKIECPHCKNINWTGIDTIAEYSKIIQHASATASKNGQSLAEWELELWAKATER